MMNRNRVSTLLALGALIFLTQGACKSVDQISKDAKEANQEANSIKNKAEDTKSDADATLDEGTTKASLAAAIADDSRPEEQRLRDVYRHPYDTLMFFGVKPDSTVLELWPGGKGWYTHILGPYVGAKGKLYVTNYSTKDASEYRAKSSTEFTERLKTIPNNGQFGVIEVIPPETVAFGLENEVDVVLTFRNVHNWMKDGSDAAIYAETFKALKPGGVFGIVEHRANAGITREESIKSGYVDQQQLIAEVEAAGFKLVEASEINANAKDTKNYPEGVWTLPPAMKLKEQDSAKYLEIGESDRMTLKFMKPE